VLRITSLDGVISFPSFHATMALITAAMWRKNPLAFLAAGAWSLLVLLGTVPCGGHYLVDLIGGGAIWAAWFALSFRVEDGPPVVSATRRKT
jgi:membrane-associated phospholipid phosphatase